MIETALFINGGNIVLTCSDPFFFVSNDPRLEGVLQNAVRRSLQEMGQRCVQELEKEARAAT